MRTRIFFFALSIIALLFISCLSSAAKAEEYYSLGVSFFELKNYERAESWFTRSKFNKATKTASEYYLGRICFETGRYKDAAEYFERIIRADGENIMALRAAAYTYLKMDQLEKAEKYYQKVLEMVPETYDEGYNYALVLMALGRPEEAEQTLITFTNLAAANNNKERPEAIFLLARVQSEQNKPEAADTYLAALEKDDNLLIRAAYAAHLGKMGHKEKAVEQYKLVLEDEKITSAKKTEIQRAIDILEGRAVEEPEPEPEEKEKEQDKTEEASTSEADVQGGAETQKESQ